jgi:Fe-S cluster assembly protein SufD
MLATESKDHYIAAYQQAQSDQRRQAPGWLWSLRETGIANFAARGFPTLKDEDWKYTNVEPIVAQSFSSANGEAKTIDIGAVVEQAMVDPVAPRLVFVNGTYVAAFSRSTAADSGIVISNLSDFIKSDETKAESHLGRYVDARTQAFVALNSAFIDDGAVISIESGCRADRPIYVVFVSTAANQPVISHPRTLILLGSRSEAKIVETYLGLNGAGYFCNAVTEVAGGSDAVIEHYRLQQENNAGFHVGTLAAHLDRGCQLTAHAVSLGGALVRNNVHVTLGGEGAGCVLNGLYLADGKQHIDNFTAIEHVKPRASSFELYKGILGGAAHGVFNGKIVVHKDAQKTDARQTNKNLLLSPNAMVNTKPQLEIYADDVKCSHGSSIGQIDADALFYLRSRGLGAEEARNLLSFAFAADVIGKMRIGQLRARLEEYLVTRFRQKEAR